MPSFYPMPGPQSPAAYSMPPQAAFEEYQDVGRATSGYASPAYAMPMAHQQQYVHQEQRQQQQQAQQQFLPSSPSPTGRPLVNPHSFNQASYAAQEQAFIPAPAPAVHPSQPQTSPQPSPFSLPPHTFDPRFSSIPSSFGQQQDASISALGSSASPATAISPPVVPRALPTIPQPVAQAAYGGAGENAFP